MAHIFGRTGPTLAGVFAADLVQVTLSGGLSTALMQSVNFNYAQAVTRLYEIGGANVYYIGGRTQGQMQIGRVIGPGATIQQLYSSYGDVCNSKNNSLQFGVAGSSCGGGQDLTYTAKYCVLTNVGVSVQAQEMIIGENAALMFSNLDVSSGAGAVAGAFAGVGGAGGPAVGI